MLVPSQREVGKVAYTLATQMNAQSAQGYDLNGVAGTDFFSTPSVQNPIANLNNTGNGSLTLGVTNSNLLANSDYKLSYDGANYMVTRTSDGTSYSNANIAGLSAAVSAGEGFSLSLSSGTINAGDSYVIRPTQYSAYGLSVAITDPTKIAAAGQGVDVTPLGTGTSTGTASLASTAARPLPNSITLTYSSGAPATITVTDNNGTLPAPTIATFNYGSGTPMTFNGITVTITDGPSGPPNNGDAFTVDNSAATSGPGDNYNALQMANLQTSKLLSNSSTTLQTTFNQIIGGNATLTNAATINQKSYQTLTDQATQAQQSFSGVNLDEEAANLIQYQQAYQAAAKAMQIASGLFNNILTAIQ
jgi:flagellar hook-associated protein 1 FlgK